MESKKSNKITVIKDLGMRYPKPISKIKRHYFLVRCHTCDKNFEIMRESIPKSKGCASCGHKVQREKIKKLPSLNKRLYTIYYAMLTRCKNNKNYKNIEVCDEWKKNIYSFFRWALNNGYKDNLTIDRINNDDGYYPDNCRWTTQLVQNRNKRKLKSTNKSGYRGVHFHKNAKKWAVQITVSGKVKSLGLYKCRLQGAYAYDKYVIENKLEHTTNF